MISVAAYGMQVVIDEDNPCISLTKDAPDEAYRGETVTFEYSVCNCGDVPLSNVKVVDAVSGKTFFYPGILEVGECWNFSDQYTIPEDWPYPKICSIAIAYGWYEDIMVQDWDCECIILKLGEPPEPAVDVIKTAVCEPEGEEIEEIGLEHTFYWEITVCNTGETDLTVWVNDTDLGLAYSEYFELSPGDCETIWLEYTVDEGDIGDGDLIWNTVYVEAWYGTQLLEDSASDCVFVAMPDIVVTKTPYCPAGFAIDEIMIGHNFYWNISVCNVGNVPLENIWVNDTHLGLSEQISLDVGECAYFELWDVANLLYVPLPFDGPPVDDGQELYIYCNEVEVEYFYCHVWYYESAESCVFIAIPDVEVTKTALCLDGESIEEMLLGHPMYWNITVTNTGNVPLYGIWINDTMLGLSTQVDLMPGESAYFQIPYQPAIEDMDLQFVICNEVVVEYFYCHAWFTETASDCIFVAIPDIDIVKTALCLEETPVDEMLIGHPMYWYINVTNTGNVLLENVWVNDTLTGFSENLSLAPGESAEWLIPYVPVVDDFTDPWTICNEVTVDYFYCHHWFSESTQACIFVVNPAASVSKVALHDFGEGLLPVEEIGEGHEIIWNITVSNDGNVPLNIWVNDSMLDLSTQVYLQPGEIAYWEIPYTVDIEDANESDFICNSVTIEWFYCHYLFSDSSEWCVFVAMPDMTVEKTSLVEFSAAGHVIEWEITVENTGNIPLMNVTVEDPLTGDYWTGIYLDVGESWTVVVNYTVPEDWCFCEEGCDSVCNVVFVTADVYGDEHCILEDNAESCVFIHCPSIEVWKVQIGPYDFSAPGHVIEWEIGINNTGNVPIQNVTIWDALTGDYWTGIYLDVGESWTAIVNFTVPEDWCECAQGECTHIINVAFFEADVYDDGHCILEGSDESAVFIHCPSVEVTKTSLVEFSAAGHLIQWEINVTNCGNIPLMNVTVEDPLTGDYWTGIYLDVGESWTAIVNFTVPEDWCECESGCDHICNVVFVTADVYDDGHCVLQDSAESCVFIHCPSIEVTKTSLVEFSAAGHVIEWEITVENTGNIPLMNVTVEDPLTGDYWTGIYLDVGESWTVVVNYTVPEDWCFMEMGDYLCNEVFVTADVFDDGHCILEDSAESCVFIACPCIEVEKTGPCEVCWDSEIVWTITVTNCGNIPLEDITVLDPLTGLEEIVSLDVGESVVFETSLYVPYGWCEDDYIHNTVYAWTWLYCDHCNVSDEATHSVFIAKPDIDIEKTGPDFAVRGETIVYNITVHNDGNVPLWDIFVTDPYLDLEWYVPYLGINETIYYEVEFTIPPCWECEHFTNWVKVDAWYYGQCCYELECMTHDEDCHEVTILDQEITVIKTGPEMAEPGETITFVINVTNTGEVPLSNVSVWDPTLGMEWYVGELGVGESWCVSVEYTIPQCIDVEGICNWAYANGTYHGITVESGDGWAVWIYYDPCADPDVPQDGLDDIYVAVKP